MSNPYLSSGRAASGGSAGNPYLNAGRSSGTRSVPAAKKKGGGILGGAAHLLGKTASDLEHAAINAPAGAYQLGRAVTKDEIDMLQGKSAHRSLDLGKAYAQTTKETVAHPLRHPGDTLLVAAPLVGGAASATVRGSAAVGELRAGAGLAKAAKAAAKRPDLGPRTLHEGKAVVHPESSRSAFGQLSQHGIDKLLHRAAEKHPRAREVLRHRIGKVVTAEARQAARNAQGPPARLIQLGRKLKPSEQKALELHAEEAPLEGRITAASARVIGARDKAARGRHQEELDLLHAAKKHLTTEPPAGHVRLYRGEGETRTVSQEAKDFYGQGHDVGGWFTDNAAVAEEYARRNKGRVYQVDIPTAAARPYSRARHSDNGETWTEYRLPDDSPAGKLAREQKRPLGAPTLKASETKLRNIYKLMQQVGGDRETVLKNLRLLTDEAITSRKANAGRVALGARHERFFQPLAEPKVGQAVRVKGQKTIGRIARFNAKTEEVTVFYPRFSRSVAVKPGELETVGRTVRETVERPVSTEEAQTRLAKLEAAHEAKVTKIAEAQFGPANMAEVRFRTQQNKKAGRQEAGVTKSGKRSGASGFKARKRPTVKNEQRRKVEQSMANAIARAEESGQPLHPALEQWRQRIDEIDRLRAALNVGPGEAKGNLGTVSETSTRRINRKAGIVGHEDFKASPEAVRIPDVATKRGTKNLARTATVGGQGTIGHLRAPGSTTHEYTGVLREMGLRRQDTAQLVGESGLEAAKFSGLLHVHTLARKAAHEFPTREDDVAVRLENLKPSAKMPTDVRKFLADPEEYLRQATPHEQATLLDRVRQQLFIDPKQLTPEARADFEKLSREGKIGWVPKRILGELGNPAAPLRAVAPRKTVGAVDTINNASRFAILYLKPAYAIPNILGNTALAIVQQGWAAPRNLAQAAKLIQKLHEGDYAEIDSAMGEGLARAVSAHGTGRLATVVDKAAGKWSTVVDMPFRRASFLHEARSAGYKTPEQIHELLTRDPHDADRIRIGLKANRDAIDYENLSNVEREIIRRVVFFYPWVKGSTVYAGRFARDHPAYVGAVGALGQQGQRYSENAFGPAPSYLEGLIPIGKNRAINPVSAAILQTPAQAAMAVQGLLSGNIPEVANAANFFTPALSLALAEQQRVDPATGIPYRPGTSAGSVAGDQLFGGLPQVSLARALKAAITGRGGSKLYPPSVAGALGQFALGGVYPRRINRGVLNQQAANEQQRLRTGR